MAEYVDKEIVKEAIGMIAKACLANPRITCGEIQTFFEGIPTADVRPVVLCGVCRWFIDTGYPEIGSDIPKLRTGHCRVLCRNVHACWFCGAGEQKEDAVGNEKD